jgi:hypothetical protein
MNLVNLRIYLVTRYERLFIGRFDLGNEGGIGESEAVFPTDPPLPRYQY